MEFIAYMVMGTACATLIGLMGWQVGCWFTEAEMNRRILEQQRQEARKRVMPKSKKRSPVRDGKMKY